MSDGGKGLAADQEASETVGDGQGIAIDSVTCSEVPFEVGGPDHVRRSHRGIGTPRVPLSRALSALRHQVVSLEDVADGAPGRPVVVGEPTL